MNRVTLVGRLGKDAESRQAGDYTVLNFTLATSKRFKTKDGSTKDETQWHNLEYFRKDNSLAQYLTKGKMVAVSGEIRYEEYEKDGQKKYITKIRVNELELLGGKDEKESAPAPQQTHTPTYEVANRMDESQSLDPQGDDLPF